MFPPAAFPHFFPELLDLGLPGHTVHKEMVAGLPLVLTAQPAPACRELVHLSAQVVSRRRVPRQELVIAARESFAFMAELLSELWAFRRAARRLFRRFTEHGVSGGPI